MAHVYTNTSYQQTRERPTRKIPTSEDIHRFGGALYKPTDEQTDMLNASFLEGVAYLCHTCDRNTKAQLNDSIVEWCKHVNDKFSMILTGNKLEKHNFLATPGDETSSSGILTALNVAAPSHVDEKYTELEPMYFCGDQATIVSISSLIKNSTSL